MNAEDKAALLQSTNPEIFDVTPRAGGALSTTKKGKEAAEEQSAAEDSIPREVRIETAVGATSYLSSKERLSELRTKMVAASISCIMLMAAEYPDLSPDLVKWTGSYLDCITDDSGNHPPNIQSLLNHMKCLEARGATGGDGSPDDGAGAASQAENEAGEAVEGGEGEAGEAVEDGDAAGEAVEEVGEEAPQDDVEPLEMGHYEGDPKNRTLKIKTMMQMSRERVGGIKK